MIVVPERRPTLTSNDSTERQREIELHSRDLEAIAELRKSPAFQGYFLRRIGERFMAADKKFHEQSPASESLRVQCMTYREVTELLDMDEALSKARLNELVPSSQT